MKINGGRNFEKKFGEVMRERGERKGIKEMKKPLSEAERRGLSFRQWLLEDNKSRN